MFNKKAMRADWDMRRWKQGAGARCAGSRRVKVPEPRTRSWAEPGRMLRDPRGRAMKFWAGAVNFRL